MGWYNNNRAAEVSELLGKTITSITGRKGDDVMNITTLDNKCYTFFHSQSCCESVSIEDIIGDLSDIVGSPLTMAEEATNEPEPYAGYDSYTWTFYKFATLKGYVTIRWLGESNGYYGEGVDFEEVIKD